MMKCEEVQEILPDYAENLLPEVTQRRVDHHMASCYACRSDYEIWSDSGEWMAMDKEEYHSVTPSRSIVDAVMARILSEEQWAIPIGRKIFSVTARMRRMGASVAVLLLLLFTFTLYVNTSSTEQANALVINGEVMAMNTPKAQVISSSMQTDDGTYVVEAQPLSSQGDALASATASIVPLDGKPATADAAKPNYSIVLSVFGILITVLTMSWLTRA
ncbi:zf-HC2 domain-containing protein [Brevibacillus agri]|uniref:Anti-sigma-W factor RsiW n=2 Tax=Brevibacillus agri TaxID=51101 RepID=A0A3M8AS28_9BACL|nr:MULTISPECIES: zf-HC2 domain-containing protein [Brevibacillus]MBY0050380.1 zf-HC2 domain-containing protein [Brevibacillus agri]MDN4091395.1 zf-HC2 domain-containing protein [Brevibacillus agri]MDR9502951.1 zf-HC2 domain-containing protein [Brevibacillus agri]MED1644760.1 zf-HC2 domain-containing protein [Brevibacillus agri]MED1655717.1 zf-HC2 domain-containing protein [Brevibacillus agri]